LADTAGDFASPVFTPGVTVAGDRATDVFAAGFVPPGAADRLLAGAFAVFIS